MQTKSSLIHCAHRSATTGCSLRTTTTTSRSCTTQRAPLRHQLLLKTLLKTSTKRSSFSWTRAHLRRDSDSLPGQLLFLETSILNSGKHSSRTFSPWHQVGAQGTVCSPMEKLRSS